MKEPRAIKTLSIAAIVVHIIFLILAGSIVIQWRSTRDAPVTTVSVFIILLVLPLLYPIQLLRIRKTYYSYISISKVARVWAHIFRIIGLMYTILLLIMLAATIRNLYMLFRENNNSFANYNSLGELLILLLVSSITFNIFVFFKGWRLLKWTRRNNYIDDVMSSFDEPLPRQ